MLNRSASLPMSSLPMSTSVLKALISKDTHLVFFISRQAWRCQQAFSNHVLVTLISKDTHLVFSISRQASRCHQAFSKPCLVNLISNDTHLVFSIYRGQQRTRLIPNIMLKMYAWNVHGPRGYSQFF